MSNQVSPLEAAKAHFRSKIDGGLKKITVPEWPQPDGSPTEIWVGPENSQQADEYGPLVRENKTAAALVRFLIVRARTAEGKRMFPAASEVELMKEVDPQVIAVAVKRMQEAANEEVTVDAAGKS